MAVLCQPTGELITGPYSLLFKATVYDYTHNTTFVSRPDT